MHKHIVLWCNWERINLIGNDLNFWSKQQKRVWEKNKRRVILLFWGYKSKIWRDGDEIWWLNLEGGRGLKYFANEEGFDRTDQKEGKVYFSFWKKYMVVQSTWKKRYNILHCDVRQQKTLYHSSPFFLI